MRKFTSPSAIQVKNRRKNQYWREIRCNKPTWKRQTTVDICRNVRFVHNSVCTIRDNVARITES